MTDRDTDRRQVATDDTLEPTDVFDEREECSLTLADVPGQDDSVAKLREVVVAPLVDPDATLRTQTVLFEGPEEAAPEQLATATAGTLTDHGVNVLNPAIDQHRAAIQDMWRLIDERMEELAPAVILLNPEMVRRVDSAPTASWLEKLNKTNARVAVFCAHTRQKRPGPRRPRDPTIAEAAELRVEVPDPDPPRQRALVKQALQRLADSHDIAYDVSPDDLERLIQDGRNLSRTDCEAVTHRAAILADSETTGDKPGCITADDLEIALDQRATESVDCDRWEDDAEFEPTVPNVTYDDVGGHDAVLNRLQSLFAVREYAGVFKGTPLEPSTGILLHGPPGTGKTHLAKALANETDRAFFALEGAEVRSKWFGQSEKRLRDLFAAAREAGPSLVFLDELDALAPERSGQSHSTVNSIVTTLLTELDGLEATGDIIVVGATNCLEMIDPAVLRSGRLGIQIEVGSPSEQGRREIFHIHTRNLDTRPDLTPAWFGARTSDDLTGADIAAVVERALQLAVRDQDMEASGKPTLTREYVKTALDEIQTTAADTVEGFA